MSSIKKNIAYNIFYQILNLGLPFITAPYIARVLGVNNVGAYSYTHAIAQYFVLFAMLGLNNYGNREIARNRGNREQLSKTFFSIYYMQVITSIIALTAYFFTVIYVVQKAYKLVAVIFGLLVISPMFDINWFFFGMEKFKLTVMRNSIVKIISTLLIFAMVRGPYALYIYTAIFAGSVLLSAMVLWGFVKQDVDFYKPTLNEIIIHLKPNLILFVPVIAVSIYRMMDKIMLTSLSNSFETGIYESADRIATIPLSIVATVGTVMLPRISFLVSQNNQDKISIYFRDSMQFVVGLSIAMAFGVAAISDRFVPIYYGNDFIDCAALIKMLCPVLCFSAWAHIIRTQYLIPNRKTRSYIVSVFAGAIVNVIINGLLIGSYGARGAAYGTIAAEFLGALIQTIAVSKKVPILLCLKDQICFLISGIVMYAVLLRLDVCFPYNIMGLVEKIVLGIVLFVICVYVLYLIIDRKRLIQLKSTIHVKR